MDKNKLRKEYLIIRKNIKNKDIKSNIIMDKIIKTREYNDAKVIAIYNNLRSEVATKELIKYSYIHGKVVLLPRISYNKMKFYKINSLDDKLIKSNFGIFEPLAIKENMIASKNIDLMIIPGICFDKDKNRVGFGKGYYDKYLENTNIKKMAICFEEQVLVDDKITSTNNDIKMDMIITDKNIY